jgi:hypothetical protein
MLFFLQKIPQLNHHTFINYTLNGQSFPRCYWRKTSSETHLRDDSPSHTHTFLNEEVLYYCSELAESSIYNGFTEILYSGCLNIVNCIFLIKCCMTHTGWSADINQEIPYDGDDGEYLTWCSLSSLSEKEFSLVAVSSSEDTLWWEAPHMPVSLITLWTGTL